MRVLLSTYESVTPDLDDEEREALAALAGAGVVMRATRATDTYGQEGAEVRLRGYTTEDGQERWAVISSGHDYRDVSDTADEAEADAAYEEEVRNVAESGGEDDAPLWGYSDVSGVPHAAYTLLVERKRDGEWEGEEVQGYLGRFPSLPYLYSTDDHSTATDLAGAALEIMNGIASQQADANYDAALMRAVGASFVDESAEAVRVTVTGVGADGEETHTEERAVPTQTPTEEEIEKHRRLLGEVDAAREAEYAAEEAAYYAEVDAFYAEVDAFYAEHVDGD
ncbi:hypothetical protein [Streptomyces sp. NPDC088915]|uniref:hypothetical protein n=1 Tax=Streptomyces sp. NPDC088915 TaxID=3365912 RepID=UPI003821A6E4